MCKKMVEISCNGFVDLGQLLFEKEEWLRLEDSLRNDGGDYHVGLRQFIIGGFN